MPIESFERIFFRLLTIKNEYATVIEQNCTKGCSAWRLRYGYCAYKEHRSASEDSRMKQEYSELENRIAQGHDNICELYALKNGKKALELYRHGYQSGDTLHVMSVTKSVVSLLIGIAIDKGYIGGTEDAILRYFPDYVPKRGEKTIRDVKICHLLTMTAPYKYRSEPWTKVCTSEDWTKAALDILGGRSGVTGEFKYSTLGIQILTGMIANASGMSSSEFANRYLFEPLGIPIHHNAEAESKEEQFDFLMSKEPKGDVWFCDPRGVNTAGWGLALSAGDMARLGQLCLGRGEYDGKQIVSAQWIDAMTTPRVKCDERFANMSYGYLWWLIDTQKHIYAAIGDGGNVIYVNPDANSVVAVAATFKPRVFDRVAFIMEKIEPLLEKEQTVYRSAAERGSREDP